MFACANLPSTSFRRWRGAGAPACSSTGSSSNPRARQYSSNAPLRPELRLIIGRFIHFAARKPGRIAGLSANPNYAVNAIKRKVERPRRYTQALLSEQPRFRPIDPPSPPRREWQFHSIDKNRNYRLPKQWLILLDRDFSIFLML